MKNKTATPTDNLGFSSKPRIASENAATVALLRSAPMTATVQRYSILALIMAIGLATILLMLGHRSLGKGLLLGTVLSIVNFLLMAAGLRMKIGHMGAKRFVRSLASIYLRYALMAAPLILAVYWDQIAVATVAAGLFMVQIAIVAEHLWAQWSAMIRKKKRNG